MATCPWLLHLAILMAWSKIALAGMLGYPILSMGTNNSEGRFLMTVHLGVLNTFGCIHSIVVSNILDRYAIKINGSFG